MKATFLFLTGMFLSVISYGQHNLKLSEYEHKTIFIENNGQVFDQDIQLRPDVKYYGEYDHTNFYLRKDGISYQFIYKESDNVPVSIYRIDINWIGTNEDVIIDPIGKSIDYRNFYLAGCTDGITNVHSYYQVYYNNLYPGINMKWYIRDNALEYDFIVSPGADYRQIKWEIKGAEEVFTNERGQLVIKTPSGTIIEDAPVAIQNNIQLQAKWQTEDNHVGFTVLHPDPKLELTIDPVIRNWSTYYGGSASDQGTSCVIDKNSNIYLSGTTSSLTHIATSGSYQTNMNGAHDAFLVKFNSNGVRIWSTYYGGNGEDLAYRSCIDSMANIFVVGKTNSQTSIATPGSQQTAYSGPPGVYDAFIIKFDRNGIRQWGTYYGAGISGESANDCAMDRDGNFYITGSTISYSYMGTAGAYQKINNGSSDAYLAKFTNQGILQWSTYYGGVNEEIGRSCTTDPFNNVYLFGITNSTSKIASSNAHQTTFKGEDDAFLVKFNANGTRLWATYYGGTLIDWAMDCVTDDSANVFIAGYTKSSSNIASTGSFQPSKSGNYDAFLIKFDPGGNRKWGTYYGGLLGDDAVACDVDVNNSVYLIGSSDSENQIATTGSNNGKKDAFIAKFGSNGTRIWGNYFGGPDDDQPYSGLVDKNMNIYICGATYSDTLFASQGSHQQIYGGSVDAFLLKGKECKLNTNVNISGSRLSADSNMTSYQWIDCDNGVITGATNSYFDATFNGNYAVIVFDAGCLDTSECYLINWAGISNSHEENIFILFPNPTTQTISIDIHKNFMHIELKLYNIHGQVIDEWNLKNKQKVTLDINHPIGIYFLKINADDKEYVFKVIKQ